MSRKPQFLLEPLTMVPSPHLCSRHAEISHVSREPHGLTAAEWGLLFIPGWGTEAQSGALICPASSGNVAVAGSWSPNSPEGQQAPSLYLVRPRVPPRPQPCT